MSRSGEPAARQHPAPGSQVPGAPPPLKRALTPADGVAAAPAPAEHPRSPAVRDTGAVPHAPAWTVAAAMAGVAAGLELAGVLARIGAGRRRTKRPKC